MCSCTHARLIQAAPSSFFQQIIAESYYFFKCFIAPVSDALKNETSRYIKPDSSYRSAFYSAIGNISVARDIYMLVSRVYSRSIIYLDLLRIERTVIVLIFLVQVKGFPMINTCDLPRRDENCTFMPQPMVSYLLAVLMIDYVIVHNIVMPFVHSHTRRAKRSGKS